MSNDLNEVFVTSMTARGSQPAKLYGLPKIHKVGVSMRPILSMIDIAQYNVAKTLKRLLKPLENNSLECKNSFEFVNQILHFKNKSENCVKFYLIEQLEKERKQLECINAAPEKVVNKFKDIEIDPASDFKQLCNFNPVFKNKKSKTAVFNHHHSLPNNFRMLILGESNCGKTNLLLKMILTPGGIDFNNLIIFSSTAEQNEYQLTFSLTYLSECVLL